jgi:hypothetical protein
MIKQRVLKGTVLFIVLLLITYPRSKETNDSSRKSPSQKVMNEV